MDIQIFQYKESHLEGIRIILNEYLSFIAKELIRPPWNFNLDAEKAYLLNHLYFKGGMNDKLKRKENIVIMIITI